MKSKNWAVAALVVCVTATGCLARPLSRGAPTTKVNFTSTLPQQAIDKVDLLFAIDNSASMGDKQAILKDAVPNLIQGLLTPPCVDRATRVPTGRNADPNGNKENNYQCPSGSEPDFKPVTDMHIGIVSSSLGSFVDSSALAANGFGDDLCPGSVARQNDRGHLVNKGTNPANAPDDFLAWYPSNKENESDKKRHPDPKKPIGALDGEDGITPSFQSLVVGVDQTGCGLEAQLESVYRFLIQPDPWDHITLDASKRASPLGIDLDVLQQRASFLRPDSLVAIIMLTDEDDSSADPMSVGGLGFAFMTRVFPGSRVSRGKGGLGTTAPRGTKICETNPSSPDCTSCAFAAACDPTTEKCRKIQQDENCTTSPVEGQHGPGFDGYYGPFDDDINVRFHRMKERYGVDPQYPLSRYVNGFKQPRVPNRDGEHAVTEGADGTRRISDYVVGAVNCTNPLFAQTLPTKEDDELCLLPRSTRTADRVFFAIVGGVPHELLHFDPSGTDKAAENNRITPDDWVKIIGKDPANYDFSGIDPHMIQSVSPRAALAASGSSNAARGDNGSDPVHGREWNTNKKDLQYACTFKFPKGQEKDCSSGIESCDCSDPPEGGTPKNSPLCKSGGPPVQVKAKAYPTTRELQLAHALGEQGVVASLCPIQVDDPEAPDYGFKPAVASILDRLKTALTTQCLPQQLRTDAEEAAAHPTDVPCLVLAQLSPESGQTCASLGLPLPEPAILEVFQQQQRKESGNVGPGGVDFSKREVCQIEQKVVAKGESCATDGALSWCYVSNDSAAKKMPAGRNCPQALIFSSGTAALTDARFSLQCIQQFSEGEAAHDGANSDN